MRERGRDGLRTAAYWRGKAEQARTLADDMTHVDAKNALVDIALKFDWMARQAARRERHTDSQRLGSGA